MIVPENIADYIKLYKFLDPRMCQDVIEHLNTLEWQKHSYYDYTSNTSNSYEDDLYVNSTNTFYKAMIQQKLWGVIQEYVNEINLPWFNNWHGYSELRFNKYETGTTMKLHCDHIQSLFDGSIKGIPTLTLLGFLNEDFEGGDLMLCGEKLNTHTGEIVVFPSNFMYPHEVKTVTKGTRYSYVSWVY